MAATMPLFDRVCGHVKPGSCGTAGHQQPAYDRTRADDFSPSARQRRAAPSRSSPVAGLHRPRGRERFFMSRLFLRLAWRRHYYEPRGFARADIFDDIGSLLRAPHAELL